MKYLVSGADDGFLDNSLSISWKTDSLWLSLTNILLKEMFKERLFKAT